MLIDIILDKLAPHTCVGCGQEGTLLCSICAVSLDTPTDCRPANNLQSIKAATVYDGIAKELVWRLKFKGARAAAVTMTRHMSPLVRANTGAFIVPVPTTTRRVRQRGYDQAKLLAKQLAQHTQLPYRDCLRRSGQAHQVGSSRQQRLAQLQAAFHVKFPVPGDHIILVDDVLTTGATLEAAASVLNEAGASHIEAIVFAYAE